MGQRICNVAHGRRRVIAAIGNNRARPIAVGVAGQAREARAAVLGGINVRWAHVAASASPLAPAHALALAKLARHRSRAVVAVRSSTVARAVRGGAAVAG